MKVQVETLVGGGVGENSLNPNSCSQHAGVPIISWKEVSMPLGQFHRERLGGYPVKDGHAFPP